LNSGFKYTLLRPFRVEDYYFVNEEHGVVIRSVEIDQVVNAEYNKRVEKILMIRNSKNLMKL
jgi:small-conductance mechanosensitive channel